MSRPRKLKFQFFFLCLLPVWFSLDHCFFWDTIQLSSKHAHWFFDTNFNNFWLPQEMDSGHFPVFGMYLAACWALFGKSLLVSHLAMLPFLFGVFYFLSKIGDFFLGEKRSWWLLLLFFIDPVFAGQSVLVTPDIAVVACFFMALDAILKSKKLQLGVAAFLLAMLSMRGMMIVVSLYLFSLLTAIIARDFSIKASFSLWFLWLFRQAIPFIPSGIFALVFLLFHYLETGWIGYHPDSPWASSFDKVDLNGFIKNIAVLTWRLLDFGRIFLFISIAAIGFSFFKKMKTSKSLLPLFKEKKLLLILALFLTTFTCLTPSVLIHKGLLLHRYLLPILFTVDLLALYLVCQLDFKNAKIWFFILFIGLATGNLWVYPKHIAQGWDATLAHLPYYDLREEMLLFIEKESIPKEQVGSAFPAISGFEYTDLRERNGEFVKFDLSKNPYILYSNIMNDFSDEELIDLEKNWLVVKKVKRGGVIFILYKQADVLSRLK